MKKTILTVIVTVITLVALATAGYLYLSQKQQDKATNPLSNKLSEKDLKKIARETEMVSILVCGVDYSEELTDVIMYVQYDPKQNSARVLSIPRDTFIGDDYATGKINQVYKSTGKMEVLMDEVRERFLLPVDYYATITLDALGNIVDEIGGVEITIPQDVYNEGIKMFSEGTQVLNGEQALNYVRIRHAYVNEDLGRIEAQHNFLMAAMRKLQSQSKIQVLQLVLSNASAVRTDIPLTRMLSIASAAFEIKEENIKMFTVPGAGKMNYSYAVYEVDCEALAQIINEHFDTKPVTAEALGFPEVTYQPPVQPAPEEVEESEDSADVREEETDDDEDFSSEEETSQESKPRARKLTEDEVRKARQESSSSNWRDSD